MKKVILFLRKIHAKDVAFAMFILCLCLSFATVIVTVTFLREEAEISEEQYLRIANLIDTTGEVTRETHNAIGDNLITYKEYHLVLKSYNKVQNKGVHTVLDKIAENHDRKIKKIGVE